MNNVGVHMPCERETMLRNASMMMMTLSLVVLLSNFFGGHMQNRHTLHVAHMLHVGKLRR